MLEFQFYTQHVELSVNLHYKPFLCVLHGRFLLSEVLRYANETKFSGLT